MAKEEQEPFFDYFQREMTYLRRQGSRFAAQHPKIASGLDFDGRPSSDPHTERLLESFAFLTARLQRDIDDQVPRISSALLSALYPHYTEPFPSVTIASFHTSPEKGKMTTSHRVERGTSLFAYTDENETCHFQTCYDVDLVPLHVLDADIITRRQTSFLHPKMTANRFLRLTLRGFQDSLGRFDLGRLRFYIHGEPLLQHTLYEGLFAQDNPTICFFPDQDQTTGAIFLKDGSLAPVGFEDDLLPNMGRDRGPYGILSDYCRFPQKFFFFDIKNVPTLSGGRVFSLLISLADDTRIKEQAVSADTFRLGCTPIINLFPKTSEPIRLDHLRTEYKLVGDYRHEKSTEIHSVLSLHGAVDDSKEVHTYTSYFSYRHHDVAKTHPLFWYGRRAPFAGRAGGGTDLYVSLVDEALNPRLPPDQTIFAKTLCTNRDLARSLRAGTILYSNQELPVHQITCLDRPTDPQYALDDGVSQWRLISHLSLNHLSFSGAPSSLDALKEMMGLYMGNTERHLPPEMDSLVQMEIASVVRRFGVDAWRGFVQGSAVTLTFDLPAHGTRSPFLFACVLNQFFGLYAHVHSFVELSVRHTHREGIWKTWPLTKGAKPIL